MQAPTGQNRQARGFGQARRVALTFKAYAGRLIGAPRGITALAPRTQHHNRISVLRQRRPFVERQRRLALQACSAPLHDNRQAHQQKAAKTQGKTHGSQPWP
ncbi:hypothetical protein D3C87_1562770 [compost metagenome]